MAKYSSTHDEANAKNKSGGMGLTGGIVDVGGLYDCLVGINTGKATPDILDSYNEIQRQKYNDMTDPISRANIRRLFDQDPEKALENDEFLKLCKQAATDRESSRKFQLVREIVDGDVNMTDKITGCE